MRVYANVRACVLEGFYSPRTHAFFVVAHECEAVYVGAPGV